MLTKQELWSTVGLVVIMFGVVLLIGCGTDSPTAPSPVPVDHAAQVPTGAAGGGAAMAPAVDNPRRQSGSVKGLQHYGKWVCTDDGNHCRQSQGEASDREWERGWEFDTFELDVTDRGTIRVCELARNGQRLRTNPYGSDDCPTNVALHGGAIISSIWFSKPGGALHRDPRHDHRRWTVRQIIVQCGTERPSGGAMTATVQINAGRSGRWSPSAQVCQ